MSTSYWKKVGRGKWWKNCRLSTCCSRTAKGNFFLNRFAKNYSVCYANFYCNFRHAKLIKVYKEKKIHHHHEYKSSKNSTVQTVLKESRLQLTFMTSSLVTFFLAKLTTILTWWVVVLPFSLQNLEEKIIKEFVTFFSFFQASIWLLQRNTRKKMSFCNRYAFREIELTL